jgi:hypothetical protein
MDCEPHAVYTVSIAVYIVRMHHVAGHEMIRSDKIDDLRQAEQELRERRLDSLMGHLPGLAYRALADEHWTSLSLARALQT